VNKFLDHLEEWLITVLMGAATVVVFVVIHVTQPACRFL
jgi:TRAP-type C4-dicarboxylate transport system permease small subunit